MSDGTLPNSIEPGKWADREAVLATVVPLNRFGRLLKDAASDAGDVQISCRFKRDMRGLVHVTGQLQTVVQLACQRCLEPADIVLDAVVDVFLLADEADAERLSEEEDFVVFGHGHLDLPELLEDELILALPLVARHEEDCEPQAVLTDAVPVAEPVPKENPFQVLAGLKHQNAE